MNFIKLSPLTLALQIKWIKNYKFNLERLKGYIYITTEPTNADVIINGKKVGKSPKNHDLLAGNYDLRIVKKGYQEISEKIKLNVSNLNYKKIYISTCSSKS